MSRRRREQAATVSSKPRSGESDDRSARGRQGTRDRLPGPGAAVRGDRRLDSRPDRRSDLWPRDPARPAPAARFRLARRRDRLQRRQLGGRRHGADRRGCARGRHARVVPLDPLLPLGPRRDRAVAALGVRPGGRRGRVPEHAARIDRRHDRARRCGEPRDGVRRLRAAVDPALRPLRLVGSVGSATLLYGLAFVYGASGSTDFSGISAAIGPDVDATDPLLLTGVALALVGLAFKASVAPFHQWTPDVYQGAPTPITAFMAVATKVAAFAILLRLCLHAFADVQADWAPALAGLATVTILVGNVGAIGQRSLKRLLAWSGVAQAGYMLAGVV